MGRLLDEMTRDEKACLVDDVIRKKTGRLDSDWAELVEQYDLEMSADTLRKAGVGVKLAYDAGAITGSEGNEPRTMFGAPEETVEDITPESGYVERQMMRDIARETNKAYRATARDELLREAVRDAARHTGIFQFTDCGQDTTALSVNRSSQMVVALGDIHFGEVIDVRGFLGEQINYYDEKVCADRLNRLMWRIKDIQEREKCSNIQIMIVGDCIAGMLRMSQLQNLQYGIVDSTIRFSEMLAGWIRNVADRLGVHVDVHLVGGNHDEVRPIGSKAGEFPKDNMIKIIQWYLEAKLEGYSQMVKIHPLTGKYHYVNVEGYHFLMLHGDGGKIQDLCRDAVNVYGQHVDFFVCGHLHHEEEIYSGTTKGGNSVLIRVPSMCGMDGFAQKLGRFSRPGATVMIIQQGYGRRCVYPIELDDRNQGPYHE